MEKITRIHKDSRETYGAPRIHFELRTLGVRCARKRVGRLIDLHSPAIAQIDPPLGQG